MARAFFREGEQLVALLEPLERDLMVQVLRQVVELIDPRGLVPAAATAALPIGDTARPLEVGETRGVSPDEGEAEFEAIVAGLGSLGAGLIEPSSDPPIRHFGVDYQRDPALDRLFPPGHRHDKQAAAQFRRLTEDGLRQRKVAGLRTAIHALRTIPADSLHENAILDRSPDDLPPSPKFSPDRVVLTQAEAPVVLVAFTDARLVLGDRLGLVSDADASALEQRMAGLDDHDPAHYAIAVYDFLTWLQESLTRALLEQT